MSESQEDIENGNTKEAAEAAEVLLVEQKDGVTEKPQKDESEQKEDESEQKEDESKQKENESEQKEDKDNKTHEAPQEETEKTKEKKSLGIGDICSKLHVPKKADIGRKKRRAELKLDIPCAQQNIPKLSIIPATGSISHRSLDPEGGDEDSDSDTNSCLQCLTTAKLVWTLLSMVLDQVTDVMALERFFRTGHMFFFAISLVFFIAPILILSTYATKKLKRKLEWTWLDTVLNFFLAPYWLIFININNSVKNGRSHQTQYETNTGNGGSMYEMIKDEKAMVTLHTMEGALEAIPQVYIQIAAYMTIPITNRYDEVVARLPLTMSVISVAWSVVANLEVGTSNVFWAGVHRFFAASEVGVAMTTRAMVAGCLFWQLYPSYWEWIWLLPMILSVLVTWFIMFFSVRSFKALMMPLKKALALPPADMESIFGLMPFLVAVLCLLPATYEPLLYFIGFEFLAGLSWFCFTVPKEGKNVLLE